MTHFRLTFRHSFNVPEYHSIIFRFNGCFENQLDIVIQISCINRLFLFLAVIAGRDTCFPTGDQLLGFYHRGDV
jgi:hypothetical protein